ncbi:MAG: hypothetical protein NZM33_17670, partial [Bryobacteraceae bacterium]|nr:hypothetical protein [Bryobacteraceae bacterium]
MTLRPPRQTISRLAQISLPFGTLSITIFVLGLAIRLALVWLWQLHYRPEDVGEWERIAKNLAETGRFADPYGAPTGPTAHSAPAYPFLLSLAFRAGGYDSDGRLIAIVLNATLASLMYACLPVLAKLSGLPTAVGLLAGLIGALVPMRVLTELMLAAGGSQLRGLTWIGLQILTLAWFRDHSPSATRALVYGVACGVAFHADPGLLPVCLLWLGLLTWLRRLRLKTLAAACLGASLALLPWTLRNRVQLGGWVFVRSNFGLELALSNNDRAHPILAYEAFPAGSPQFRHWMTLHPGGNPDHLQMVRQLGEVAYNRRRLGEAVDWIQRNPERFLLLSLQ